MKKTKMYEHTHFPLDVFKDATEIWRRCARCPDEDDVSYILDVKLSGESWGHDDREEFFADYRKGPSESVYVAYCEDSSLRIVVMDRGSSCVTSVDVTLAKRSDIEAVFDVFEQARDQSSLPESEEPAQEPSVEAVEVFIGHGRSSQWRELKDHLSEKHGLAVLAYEIGARAGHTIRDILEDLLQRSSFAVLVMTAEDETAAGELRPRQNVVHEIGLFQGRLGFSRAIVLMEEGAEEFSNLQGIQQIRFARGRIRETYGDVLATIRREFGAI